MKFQTRAVADVSTRHITKLDGALLRPGAPYHLGEIADGNGSLFYVPMSDLTSSQEVHDTLKAHGFSNAFVNIFLELRRQELGYVRFDVDGDEVEGAPEFEW